MQSPKPPPRISVIMPTYNQAAYILGSVNSLLLQTFDDWELILINDGSTDDTDAVIREYVLNKDSRISYFQHTRNKGLGACLNRGIGLSKAGLIAYLPSDDLYFKDHLQSLYDALAGSEKAILAYSGVRYHSRKSTFGGVAKTTTGKINDLPLQLVQVLHKRTDDRWMEREELITDDLHRMFWNKLGKNGSECLTQAITCEWVEHPLQRHKIIKETTGGIFRYKEFYHVTHPLRYHSTVGNYIDEVQQYQSFRNRPVVEHSHPLKILLVGELSYNPERLIALEEQGHILYGLWLEKPYYFNSTGPFPFGNVETIPHTGWLERVREIKPDIIYALLNGQAVPLAHQILLENPGIPFVWHFKEGPMACREAGVWDKLVTLYSRSDGQIYINNEAKAFYSQFLHGPSDLSFILDGDLPKRNNQGQQPTPLLSEQDGEFHTVSPGRLMGFTSEIMEELAGQKIHVHFYGEVHRILRNDLLDRAPKVAGRFFHLHPNCTQENWISEFSQYDAGWLHLFLSSNQGELTKVDWHDLNLPSRMATLGVAGVPMLQADNTGHIVATQALVRQHDIGYFIASAAQLKAQLSDRKEALRIRKNAWEKRGIFTFDHHVDELIDFFRSVIRKKADAA